MRRLCAAACAAMVSAQADAEHVAASAPRVERSWLDAIDRLHDTACSYIVSWGEGMDGWLADRLRDPRGPRDANRPPLVFEESQAEESEGSRIILTPTFEAREYEGVSLGLKFRAKLSLPRVSRRVDLLFDSDIDDTDLTPNIGRAGDIGQRTPDQGSATLRLRLDDVYKFKTSLDTGLKFKPEPVPRVGLRGRLTHRSTNIAARLTQTFFWDGDEGWGERTTLDLEQSRKDRYIRRSTTSIRWSEGSDGVQGGQTLQFYKFLSRRRAVGFSIAAYGPLEPSAHVDTYSLRGSWRQRIHRDWLFVEIEPGVDWPRDRDYQEVFLIRVKFDIVIGDWIEGRNGKRANETTR
jgi:hypothetical protein